MSQGDILGIFSDALMVAMKLSAPILIVSIAIGLLIAIFQAATQIHEQTLTFVPKVVVIAFMMLFMASWMITTMSDFIHRLFALIANIP